MKLMQFVLKNRKYTILFAVLAFIILAFFILQVFILDYDLFFELKWILGNTYLFLIETITNPILSILGSNAYLEYNSLYSYGAAAREFIPEIRYEVWTALLVVIVWLIKSPVSKKVIYSVLFVLANFFANLLNTVTGAYLAAHDIQSHSIIAISNTIGLLIIFTIFFAWYRNYKEPVLTRLGKFKLNKSLLESDWLVLLSVYGFILISSFLIEIFDFKIWIGFLFTSAKKVLQLFGYEVVVDNLRLIGPNGKILMSKACLGFQLMLLFTIMIVLTGDNRKARWKYIITGIIFLNLVNILRFVFLFVHLQKHGDYLLSIEAHNLYNLITYIIVFLLWVLWFEVFADARKPDPGKRGYTRPIGERESDGETN